MENKNILLVAATSQEIKSLFGDSSIHDFYIGNIVSFQNGNHSFDLLITGPGMAATAFFMGQWMAIKHYDLIINAGIAGSFNSEFHIGEVVNVVSDCFPELGAESDENFIPLDRMEMAKQYLLAFVKENYLIENLIFPEIPCLEKLPRAKGITVNTISGKKENIETLRKRTNADIESMEGAAFFFACRFSNTPCIQIRAISNYLEPRNLKNWNVDLALKNLNETLKRILDEL